MKICCVSDTHISGGLGKLPRVIYEDFKGCDLILHAGDITSLDVLDDLKTLAPVTAVAGNMDGWDVAAVLPEKRIIEAGGFRIGLTHGCCRVPGMEERILGNFEGDNVDCIVYGHSHQPKVAYVGGVLMVNPGSPTDKTYAPYNSYAVIHVGEELKAEIVRI